MYKVKVSSVKPSSGFLSIEETIETNSNQVVVILPNWRPGRYELGSFAKFIRNFKVLDANGKQLLAKKQTLNKWVVANPSNKAITLHYEFQAFTMNAGATFCSANLVVLNPVNFTCYAEGKLNEAVEVVWDLPSNLKIACGTAFENKKATFETMHLWFDSPVMAAADLETKQFTATNGMPVYMHFSGGIFFEEAKLIADFKAFTDKQIEDFGGFPANNFHFLFITTPYRLHHGVEHINSTMIVLGNQELMKTEAGYDEFLGISSHELYHCWNVKSIRPEEWAPYNYELESPSELGYIAEGVTTYMGDVYLLRSGVWSLEKYLQKLAINIQRHIDNAGRFNYSVTESSFDTWLDGYQLGIAGRKTSIYNEGLLLTFIADVLSLEHNKGGKGMIDVMFNLFQNFKETGKGISTQTYLNEVEKVGGNNLRLLLEGLLHSRTDYTLFVKQCLEKLGLGLVIWPAENKLQAWFGIKLTEKLKVAQVQAYSNAELQGIQVGDVLTITGEVSATESLQCSVLRNEQTIEKLIEPCSEPLFYAASIEVVEEGNSLLNTFVK